jgi:hypothetical protein
LKRAIESNFPDYQLANFSLDFLHPDELFTQLIISSLISRALRTSEMPLRPVLT